MKVASHALACLALAGAATCAADEAARTAVKVTVPDEVGAEATARAAGDATAAAPVLMLEGVEVVPGEALTIRVLGPPPAGSDEGGELLGTAATVGSSGADPEEPLERMTLAVPLNEHGSRLVAAGGEVTLTLEVEGAPGRPPLALARAYFDTGGETGSTAADSDPVSDDQP